MIHQLYDTSLGLLTDLYQLTMAYGYWKSGKAEQEAGFQSIFQKAPFSWRVYNCLRTEQRDRLSERISF